MVGSKLRHVFGSSYSQYDMSSMHDSNLSISEAWHAQACHFHIRPAIT
jgi:uncharacterized protein with gpF-like domain